MSNMTSSIMGGAAPSGSGLDAIFRLLAEDPAGFQAKIVAYQEAEANALAAVALVAKADELPGLHAEAKANAEETNRVLMTAQVKAEEIVKSAGDEAASLANESEQRLDEAKAKLDELDSMIEAASKELSALRQTIAKERAAADAALAHERASIADEKQALEKARQNLDVSQKAADDLLAKLDEKAARIQAIVLE